MKEEIKKQVREMDEGKKDENKWETDESACSNFCIFMFYSTTVSASEL